MDSNKKKKIINEIKNQLSIILSNTSNFSAALNDENFSRIVSKSINMLAQLEQKEKTKSANDFLDKFNIVLKNKIDSIQPTSFKEEYEFNDEIKYLNVYLKNSFNLKIDDFTINKSKINDISKLEKIENQDPKTQSNYNYESANNSFQQNPYGNPEVYRETLISQMINKRISDDYIKGNYYFFLTKPKIIPILKTISGIFLIIAGLLFISQMIITILTTNAGVWVAPPQGSSNLEPIRMSGSIYSYLILVIEAFILIYSSLSYFKKIPNDNFKYKPNNFMYYLLVFFGVISIYNSIDSISLIDDVDLCEKNTEYAKEMFKTLSYLSLSINIFLISFIIFPMLNYIYKPQENKELRSMLYQKYRKEIEDLGLVK